MNYSISTDDELVKNKIRVRNQRNYSIHIDEYQEHPRGVSITVPDQALSMRQLLTRYTRGQDITVFDTQYDGDNDLPDVSRLDKLDIIDLKRDVEETISGGREYLQQRADEKAKQKAAQSAAQLIIGEQVTDK